MTGTPLTRVLMDSTERCVDQTWRGAAETGEACVTSAMRGDADALRILWQENRRWVAAVLLAHKPRDAELDDLLQEVAAAVVGKIGGLREPCAFRPWLRAVAMNVAKTMGRRKETGSRFLRLVRDGMGWGSGFGGSGGGGGNGEGAEDGPGHRVAAQEEGARLMTLARDLPEGYREPLLLRCVHGMTYRQIGEVLGLPETTVETRIARGRRMLRDLADGSAPMSEELQSHAAGRRPAPLAQAQGYDDDQRGA